MNERNPASSAQARGGTRVSNLISVASGKGGVGKTWFAVTLAHSLARAGERVLLVDGDLGLANVDVQLGLTPGHDLASVVAGTVSAEAAMTPVEGGANGERHGFDVLAGRSGSGALSALKPDELRNLVRTIQNLAPKYDRVILDLGAGIDAPVRLLCAAATRVLVILTDEPTSLTDAYALVKLLYMRDTGVAIDIVVNMAESVPQGRRTHQALAQACRSFLGREPPLAGIVRRDKLVKEAIRQQTALLARYPQSAAASDVGAVVKLLKGENTNVKSTG
jgi:flagellar biosynthesis protein FlhG